jgi:hypothetical protein
MIAPSPTICSRWLSGLLELARGMKKCAVLKP